MATLEEEETEQTEEAEEQSQIETTSTQDKAGDYMVESDPTQTTEGILNRITSSGSDYMKNARNEGINTAASRGLLNTSIAATAGESAALDYASDIAAQDAAAYQENLNTAQQGAISSDLSSQEAQQASDLSAQESEQSLEQELAVQEAELAWEQSKLSQQIELELAQMDADQQETFAELSSTLSQEYIAQYTAILNNTDLKSAARSQALEKLNNATEAQYALLASVYSVELNWGDA